MNTYEITSDKSFENEQKNKAMYAIAAVAGAMGSVSDGLSIGAAGAELLPQLAALAVPGLAAWAIARLMFNKDKTAST